MERKIGLFVNTLDGYHGQVADGVMQAAQRDGIELEIIAGDASSVKQAQDLVRFSFSNPDRQLCAFVIPVADARIAADLQMDPVVQLARRALQKEMGFVLLNHGREDVVHALRAEFPQLPVGMVVVDNVEFGRVQGQQLRAILPRGGRVLCVRGNPLDSASAGRSEGLARELAGNAFEFEHLDAHWMDDVAEESVHKWLTSGLHRDSRVDAIVAQNDHMGMGSRRALERASLAVGRPEWRRTPVLGGDGLPGLGLRWLEQGVLTSTVSVTLPGPAAVQALSAHWRGEVAFPAVTRLPVHSHPALERLQPKAASAA